MSLLHEENIDTITEWFDYGNNKFVYHISIGDDSIFLFLRPSGKNYMVTTSLENNNICEITSYDSKVLGFIEKPFVIKDLHDYVFLLDSYLI